MLTRDQKNEIARNAIEKVEDYIAEHTSAETRLLARSRLDDAKKALARDAARAALGHACRAAADVVSRSSLDYAVVQNMHDIVYKDFMEIS